MDRRRKNKEDASSFRSAAPMPALLRGPGFTILIVLTNVNSRPTMAWMSRPRHPNKHKAIRYAETLGWRVRMSKGHAWGRLYCPHRAREGCIVSVWSTPRNPENHARQIRREVDLVRIGQLMARVEVKKMKHKERSEKEYDFALVLTGITELTSKVENALFEAGCDDATLSRRSGRVYLTFSRRAPTLKDAILSAIRDVRKAPIGADVLRIDRCDLVSQSEIARRIGRTRQLVHQYLSGERGPGGFPSPVCHISDNAPLWMWCEVAHWLWQNDMIKEEVVREAQHVAVINDVLDLHHQKQFDPQLIEEAWGFVAR